MSKRDGLSSVELMILLALMRLGDDAYGVTVSAEIERETGRETALGSIYASLERLDENGLVCSELGEPTAARGGRAKKYFRVTAKGVREVRSAKQSFVTLWRGLPQLKGVIP